jgi:hypothetical protein
MIIGTTATITEASTATTMRTKTPGADHCKTWSESHVHVLCQPFCDDGIDWMTIWVEKLLWIN